MTHRHPVSKNPFMSSTTHMPSLAVVIGEPIMPGTDAVSGATAVHRSLQPAGKRSLLPMPRTGPLMQASTSTADNAYERSRYVLRLKPILPRLALAGNWRAFRK